MRRFQVGVQFEPFGEGRGENPLDRREKLGALMARLRGEAPGCDGAPV